MKLSTKLRHITTIGYALAASICLIRSTYDIESASYMAVVVCIGWCLVRMFFEGVDSIIELMARRKDKP